jgi:hypothetical protein
MLLTTGQGKGGTEFTSEENRGKRVVLPIE